MSTKTKCGIIVDVVVSKAAVKLATKRYLLVVYVTGSAYITRIQLMANYIALFLLLRNSGS